MQKPDMVFHCIRDHGALTAEEICERVGFPNGEVMKALLELVESDFVMVCTLGDGLDDLSLCYLVPDESEGDWEDESE